MFRQVIVRGAFFRAMMTAARAFAVAAVLYAPASFAAEITLEQAKAAVGNWIAQGGGFGKFSGGAVVSGETLEDSSAGVKMHLVRISGNGFVVTSADDGIEPVLLFSDGAGAGFAAEDGDPVWDMLRWDLAARIASLASVSQEDVRGEIGAGPSPQEQWAALLPAKNPVRMLKAAAIRVARPWDVRRAPLLKTCWNQTEGGYGSVYNLYTPEVIAVTNIQEDEVAPVPDGWLRDIPVTNMLGRCPAGCVAVAGGQLMKYWASPKTVLPEKDVMCTVFGKPQSLHFYGAQVLDGVRQAGYMWDSMGISVPTYGTANEFVSRLLSDIGVACGASYDAIGTAMSLYNFAKELKSTFGYRGATYHTGNCSGAGLREVVIPNLDAGCPVIVGIGGSHAAVVDGYGFDEGETTFYMHVNLGWGYSSHYWYSPPQIEKYSTIDEIVCNVSPSAAGQLLSGRVTGPHGRPVCGLKVQYGGAASGSTATDANGIYHVCLSAGTYDVRVRGANSVVAGPVSVSVETMTASVNGNRIVNFSAPAVGTVKGLSSVVADASGGSPGSTITGPIMVSLFCATPGAEIRYTLDGTLPTPDSALYGGPVLIQDTTTLLAVAFADGMECSETFVRSWTFVDVVSRDNFADARPLAGTEGSSSFSNGGCTKESFEPIHSSEGYFGGASVWASWTAPSSGDWTFWLAGTSAEDPAVELDTQLAVYVGDDMENLERIAANDDSPAGGYSSRLSIHATEGVEYKIAMDAYDGMAGSMKLSWEEGYVHYVEFDHDTIFAPASGCELEIAISSSAGWNVTECSDWVVPDRLSGASGTSLAVSVAADKTGTGRTGFLTVQAGNSELQTIAVRQSPVDFAMTRDAAADAAWRTNRRILLVCGRESCQNTASTLFQIIPSATIKPLIDAGYVVWYGNCDRQTDVSDYMTGRSNETLPVICVIDPRDVSGIVATTSGNQSVGTLKKFLESVPAWDGLPVARAEIVSASSDSATVKTTVRAWGNGVKSATVSLETSGDAAFSSVAETCSLGTISSLLEEQTWSIAPPVGSGVAYCRVRIASGDWSIVSPVVEFVLLPIALDSQSLFFETGGDAPWTGILAFSHDGADAARSGRIFNGQTTWMQTKVVGPGTVSFWWNVSCEPALWDKLEFLVDEMVMADISGTNETWMFETFSIGEGTHVLRWEYSKDADRSFGSDAGWVDQIVWTGASADTYEVAYNPGVDGAGQERTATKVKGSPLTLQGAIFTRDGHVQTGWATIDGGAKAYGLAASYSDDASITLYPFWTGTVAPEPEPEPEPDPVPGTITSTVEATAAGSVMRIVLHRTGGSDGKIAVKCETQNATGVCGTDFACVSEVIVWEDGDTADKVLEIPTYASGAGKSFRVKFSTLSTGAYSDCATPVLKKSNVNAEMTVPKPGTIVVSAPVPLSVVAGNKLRMKFSRRGGSDGKIAVKAKTQTSTALMGTNGSADFDYVKAVMEWADGDASEKYIDIPTYVQPWEGTKQLRVKLSTLATGAYAGNLVPKLEVAKIYVDLENPSKFGTVSVTAENPVAGQPLKLAFRRAGGSSWPIAVKYKVQTSTALAGVDFEYMKDVITWADGESGVKYVEVPTYKSGAGKQLRVKLSTLTQGAYLGCVTPHVKNAKVYVPLR